VDEKNIIIPHCCSGDPTHDGIVAERNVPGKRSKTIKGKGSGSSWWTQLFMIYLFGMIGGLLASTAKEETIKLAFNQKVPYCADCYRGLRRSLVIRNILMVVTVISIFSLCSFSTLGVWFTAQLVGLVSLVGLVVFHYIQKRSQTMRILDFDPTMHGKQLNLRFANAAYADLFGLENHLVSLNSFSVHLRLTAAEQLGKIGNDRAILPLVKALNDQDDSVRQAATQSLLQLDASQAKEALIESLQNPTLKTRLAAITVLKRWSDDEQVVVNLIKALEGDESPKVRLAVVDALAESGETTVPALITALQDGDKDVRLQAVLSLQALTAVQAVPALIEILRDDFPEVRRADAEALGSLHDLAAIDPLTQVLQDDDVHVREAAAHALMDLAPDQPHVQASFALIHGEKQERVEATKTLAKLKDLRTVPVLLCAFYDVEAEVRQSAAIALLHFGAELALAPLQTALTHVEPAIRVLAAESLGQLADDRAEEALLDALGDEDTVVRQQAAVALIHASSPAFRPIAEMVKTAVIGSSTARQEAVKQLVALGDTRVKGFLTRLLIDDEDLDVRVVAAREVPALGVQATDLLIQALNTSDGEAATAVLVILADKVVEPLIEAVKQGNSATQGAVITILSQIEDERVEAILVEILQEDRVETAVKLTALNALGELVDKPHLVLPVVNLLWKRNYRIQEVAVQKLGRSANSLAARSLVKALDDFSIRKITCAAIQEMGDLAYEALLERYENESQNGMRNLIGDLLGDKKPASGMGRLFGRR
jgi:HEAT repeat protein